MHVLFEAEPDTGTQSLVSYLDVRTKILICLSLSLAVIFLNTPHALGFLTLVTLIYVLNLGRYRVVGICYGIIVLMWLVAISFMHLMHLVAPMIPVTSPIKILIPFLRTIVMVNAVLVLALSSRIQTLLTSLKSFKLPIWLYIPSAVMIRFVPSFIKDVQQIHETMRIRGYSLNPLFIIRHPVTSVRLMAAPIIFRALRSADDLGIAAELKGVGYGTPMESLKPLTFKRFDALAMIIAILTLIGAGIIQAVYGTDTKGFHP